MKKIEEKKMKLKGKQVCSSKKKKESRCSMQKQDYKNINRVNNFLGRNVCRIILKRVPRLLPRTRIYKPNATLITVDGVICYSKFFYRQIKGNLGNIGYQTTTAQ